MDSKYGRIFTEEDVKAIVELAVEQEVSSVDEAETLMDDFDGRFPADEPIFVLRARDKRALAAVRQYRENQSPRAPVNHIEGLDKAVREFEKFRVQHADQMKEPD